MPCPPQGCVLRPGISGPPLLGVQRARCAGRTDQSLPSVVRSVPPPPCPHSSRGSGKQGARVPPEGSEAPLRAPAVPSPPRHQLRCGWGLFSAARLLSPTHSGSVGFSSSEPGARTETKYIFLIISQSRTVTAGGGGRGDRAPTCHVASWMGSGAGTDNRRNLGHRSEVAAAAAAPGGA